MRRKLFTTVVVVILSVQVAIAQQQPSGAAAASTQAATFLTQSAAALQGTTAVTDVTLMGTAQRIVGSDDQSGSVTLKATATGGSRVDLNLSSGMYSEVRNASAVPSVGSWSGPDGVAHPIVQHNLWTDAGWFFPVFPVAHGSQPTAYAASYIGQETLDESLSVQHVSIRQLPLDATSAASVFQHLSQEELYLDSTTLLPVAIAFSVHPDDNTMFDIPVEIRFSDYRSTNGVQVPFHIQKFLNNTLQLDLQIQTVTLNSGLASSTFSVQ